MSALCYFIMKSVEAFFKSVFEAAICMTWAQKNEREHRGIALFGKAGYFMKYVLDCIIAINDTKFRV